MDNITYNLVRTHKAMRAAEYRLRDQHALAVDMEMENHFHHYGLHLALIQIATSEGTCFIFDPLSEIDVSPIGAWLADPGIEIVMHDADFDRRATAELLGWSLQRLFDTKIAAQFCGIRQFGLGSLLESLLGVKTNKRYQRFDWLRRPLPAAAIEYACRDVRYLFNIKEVLEDRLSKLGRLDWAREEFRRQANPPPAPPKPAPHLRIKGSGRLQPRQLAALKALCEARETLARAVDKPAAFVVPDRILLELAANPPADYKALTQLKGIHPAVRKSSHALSLIKAARAAFLAPPDQPPAAESRERRPRDYDARLKAMQQWRRTTAQSLDLEPHLLLDNDVLEWCAARPGRPLAGAAATALRDWQRAEVWTEFCRHFHVPAY